jgi:hypothetical protein
MKSRSDLDFGNFLSEVIDSNPRYIAYARSKGQTPKRMFEIDQAAMPGACMYGFMAWIDWKWEQWDQAHGRKPGEPHGPTDHRCFDRFIGADLQPISGPSIFEKILSCLSHPLTPKP